MALSEGIPVRSSSCIPAHSHSLADIEQIWVVALAVSPSFGRAQDSDVLFHIVKYCGYLLEERMYRLILGACAMDLEELIGR